MTFHMVAWFASEKIYDAIKSENRAQWFREALSMYMDSETVDAKVIEQLPVTTVPMDGKRISVYIGSELYAKLSEISKWTDEPMYSIATKAAMYRYLFEDKAYRTFTLRLSEEEVERLNVPCRSIADAIHSMIAGMEVSE